MTVFARRGYEAASMKELASAAKVSEALFYGHFASKQALYEALLAQQSAQLITHLSGATEADEGLAEDGTLFRLGVDAILAFVEAEPDAWRLLFRDAPADRTAAKAQQQAQKMTTQAIAKLLAERCEFQLRDDMPPDAAIHAMAALLSGALDGLAGWWLDHREVARDQVVALMMDVVWTGLDSLRVEPQR
jgi:AcrR family transcriptional regulator